MHELYELKEMLCKELEDYGKKGEMSTGTLEVVDKLAHTVKNLGKIIEMAEESEYSGYYDDGGNMPYGRGGMGNYRGSYTYARGRGSNAKRDSRGRYSSEGYSRAKDDISEKLYELMEDSPENMKQEIQRFITKIENM